MFVTTEKVLLEVEKIVELMKTFGPSQESYY